MFENSRYNRNNSNNNNIGYVNSIFVEDFDYIGPNSLRETVIPEVIPSSKEERYCKCSKDCILATVAILFIIIICSAFALGFGLYYGLRDSNSEIKIIIPENTLIFASSEAYTIFINSTLINNFTTILIKRECSKYEFQCNDGLCIDDWKQCNRFKDCTDNSDEILCECSFGQIICNTSRKCIMKEWQCDGQNDCLTNEDEVNCDNCSEDEFKCSNHECVSKTSICDGFSNCFDNSDEFNCTKFNGKYLEILYQQRWVPLCSENITLNIASQICSITNQKLVNISYINLLNQSEFLVFKNINDIFLKSLILVNDCITSQVINLVCGETLVKYDCGQPILENQANYIVNGEQALNYSWPWHVGIYALGKYLCSGSLLDQIHIVTAAHCISNPNYLKNYIVVMSSINRIINSKVSVTRFIKRVDIHPKFQTYFQGYDIAIITLVKEVEFSRSLLPICLPKKNFTLNEKLICYSTGWGLTDYNDANSVPIFLRQAKLKIWSQSECKQVYPDSLDHMLCAGYRSGYISNCVGDSGGPLVCKNNANWELIGIFSFLTKGCNVPMRPSVFTSAEYFSTWMQEFLPCKFRCLDGACIWDLSEICDGNLNCMDGSDEYLTCNISVNCSFEDKFRCGYFDLLKPGKLSKWVQFSDQSLFTPNSGPLFDVTFKNSTGKYLYSTIDQVLLVSPYLNIQIDSCFQFHLMMRAYNPGEFKIYLLPVFGNETRDQFFITDIYSKYMKSTSLGNFWYIDRIDIPTGLFVLVFEAIPDSGNERSYIALDEFVMFDKPCLDLGCRSDEFTCSDGGSPYCLNPNQRCDFVTDCLDISDEENCENKTYNCDFEFLSNCRLEQWTFYNDELDWYLYPNFALPKMGFPKIDATYNNSEGHYLIIDSIRANNGDKAVFELPVLIRSSDACLFFSIFMKGSALLKVVSDISQEEIPLFISKSYNSNSNWSSYFFSLDSSTQFIRFSAIFEVTASMTLAFVAVDDIKILSIKCPSSKCNNQEHKCGDEVCINIKLICDGFYDCVDHSDESQELCIPVVNNFNCSDGGFGMFCNGFIDCLDESDEPNTCVCKEYGLETCDNGKCFSPKYKCNFYEDCSDASDELNCDYYRCINGLEILSIQRCDGNVDCPQAEDELHCKCETNNFHCDDKLCVESENRCNGKFDCLDRSDELNCPCATGLYPCNTRDQCFRGKCDGIQECYDFSDEINCECEENQFKCGSGQCIRSDFKCDGVDDCADGTDEKYCSCKPGQLNCTINGKCLQNEWICDGQIDCPDLSDEKNCVVCGNFEFKCLQKCINENKKCDGIIDCSDHSDEENCFKIIEKVLHGAVNNSYIPICASDWSNDLNNLVCSMMVGEKGVTWLTLAANGNYSSFIHINYSTILNKFSLQIVDVCEEVVTPQCLLSTCGTPKIQSVAPYIVGGDFSSAGQWPWSTVLTFHGNYICSAAIIAEQWVLTAAHCFFSSVNGFSMARVPWYYGVRVGSVKQLEWDQWLQVVRAKRIFIHDDFRMTANGSFLNDIAILELEKPLAFNEYVSPGCLPPLPLTSNNSTPPKFCYLTGWGATDYNAVMSTASSLRHAKLQIWMNEACVNVWRTLFNSSIHLCSGYQNYYITPCTGDSGGALVCKRGEEAWTIEGVVSFGVYNFGGCAQPNQKFVRPTIFTKVSSYVNWIENIINIYRK